MASATTGTVRCQEDSGNAESNMAADASKPLADPISPETMQQYFGRLKSKVSASDFKIVDKIEEDGLYIGKRAIRGAQGQGDLLNQAGTVFYHTVLYIQRTGKTFALDYGPQGSADVTANIMEAVPCGPILQQNAEADAGHPLLLIKQPCMDHNSSLCQKAIQFAEARKYHAINNNCIQNTDFLCRILTGGRVRNAPMLYDLLAGKVPQQDHPMLLMFFLMTRLSWFHVCDGSPLTQAFLEREGVQKPMPAAVSQSSEKSAAQSRLEEKQVDLLKLVQSLQPKTNHKETPSEQQFS